MKRTRLEDVLRYMGVSVEELASQTGLTRAAIYKMINTNKPQRPTLENAAKISAALNHPIQDIWPELFQEEEIGPGQEDQGQNHENA